MTRPPQTPLELARAFDQLDAHRRAVFLAAVAIEEGGPAALAEIAPAILAEARVLLDATDEGAPCVR